jgi:hypothetical protein
MHGCAHSPDVVTDGHDPRRRPHPPIVADVRLDDVRIRHRYDRADIVRSSAVVSSLERAVLVRRDRGEVLIRRHVPISHCHRCRFGVGVRHGRPSVRRYDRRREDAAVSKRRCRSSHHECPRHPRAHQRALCQSKDSYCDDGREENGHARAARQPRSWIHR